jgi:hypothetical protein
MATVPYVMEPAVIPTAAAALVTCPANQYLITKKVVCSNSTAAAVSLTVYRVPSGGAASAANVIFTGLTIPANTVNGGAKELYELENQILNAGDTLQAFAGTASALVFSCSGILQTT